MNKSETLPRAKGYGPKCDICKYAWPAAHMPGDQQKYYDENLKDKEPDDETVLVWLGIVSRYEDQKNGVEPDDGGQGLPASRFGPTTTVNEDDSVRNACHGPF